MTRLARAVVTAFVAAGAINTAGAQSRSLDIYFIDVEGGQSTLIVTPAGESLLIDAGFPGDGTFGSKSVDPSRPRGAHTTPAAARDAGVTKIDYLMITHFHADHAGGVPEVAQLP